MDKYHEDVPSWDDGQEYIDEWRCKMKVTICLEGQTEEHINRICELKKTTPSEFLTNFLQDSTMIEEFLEETIEDLEEEL